MWSPSDSRRYDKVLMLGVALRGDVFRFCFTGEDDADEKVLCFFYCLAHGFGKHGLLVGG